MNWVDASKAAHELIQMMKLFLDRVQIAGSIRRRKDEVKDIEIVAIPKIVGTFDLFGHVASRYSMPDNEKFIDSLIGWEFDTQIKRNGPRYKRLFNPRMGIACDLFLTNLRRWAYQLAIRTGPADYSKMIVTEALKRKWHFTDSLLHQHPKIDNQVCLKGESCLLIIDMENEEDIFEALELPWLDPKDR